MLRPIALALALVAAACSGSGEPSEVDVGFVRDMVDHHEQAVRMALLVLTKDDVSPVVRSFAVDVVASQRYELGMMDGHLAVIGEPKGAPGREVMAWMAMPVPFDEMPGMASRAELDELAAASGSDADDIFLDLMIEHHEGGLHMARYAAEHGDDDLVRDLAERIVFSQRDEIGDMQRARAQLAGERAVG